MTQSLAAELQKATPLEDALRLIGLSRPASVVYRAIWALNGAPPCADDLVQLVGLSRSNISTALRSLRDMGLIEVLRLPDDRRDRFKPLGNIWQVATRILLERERSVLTPALDRLHMLQSLLQQPDKADPVRLARIDEAVEAVETLRQWYRLTSTLSQDEMKALLTQIRQKG